MPVSLFLIHVTHALCYTRLVGYFDRNNYDPMDGEDIGYGTCKDIAPASGTMRNIELNDFAGKGYLLRHR
jgi:hypothetical protein